MKNLLLFVAMLMGATPVEIPQTNNTNESSAVIVESVNTSFSKVELKVRAAAVKVLTNGGHGSGSYLVHKGFYFVLTAQHVADGPLGTNYTVAKGEEYKQTTLVYSSAKDDIAVLYVPDKSVLSLRKEFNIK